MGVHLSALKKQQEELEYLSDWEPLEYIRSRSPKRWFSIGTIDAEGKWQQRTYRTSEIETLLPRLREEYKNNHLWISQTESFAPTRLKEHFSRAYQVFCDIDTYADHVDDARRIQGTGEEQTQQFLEICDELQVPRPSHVVFSGRGLQIKWLLSDYVNEREIETWYAVQDRLQRLFECVGGDAAAKDESRILRFVGSTHIDTGETVRVTYANGLRYRFIDLCKQLGVSRVLNKTPSLSLDLRSGGVVFANELEYAECPSNLCNEPLPDDLIRILKKKPKVISIDSRNSSASKQGSAASKPIDRFFTSRLASDRLEDLVRLAQLRNPTGAVADGKRDIFVFLAAVFLVQAHTSESIVQERITQLTKMFAPHWTENHLQNAISAALKRLRMAIKGVRLRWGDEFVDPRYFFKNATLMKAEWLAITAEEEKYLKTIISAAEAQRRDTARAALKRRQNNIDTLDEHLSKKEAKRAAARDLRADGKSWQEIADLLGYKNAESARKSVNTNYKTSTSIKEVSENKDTKYQIQPLSFFFSDCSDTISPPSPPPNLGGERGVSGSKPRSGIDPGASSRQRPSVKNSAQRDMATPAQA